MEIIKVNENKEKYMNLILEADPYEHVTTSYINKSEMYVKVVKIRLFVQY